MSLITTNPDKFGFYQAGEHKTFSKFEAIELGRTQGKSSSWNFNDNVYGQFDWTVEPPGDIWNMYKERARQIRESYDYVVLAYSGGSDSHNMLNAWIEADCKLDEILSFWNYEGSDDYQSHMSAEITNVVIPDIQKLRDQGLDFQFRLVDTSKFNIDVIRRYGLNYEYNANYFFTPNNPAKSLLREEITDYARLIEEGKRLCIVWGLEKPQVRFDGNRYYSQFVDVIDMAVSPYVQRKYFDGWYDELFYWTPDFPLLPIKAAHLVKNFLTKCHDPIFYQDVPNSYGFNKVLGKYLTDNAIKTIIYPRWDNNIFCNGKSSSFIFSIRDTWFLHSNLAEKDWYNNMIYSLVKNVGMSWFSNRNVKVHQSKRYYLE